MTSRRILRASGFAAVLGATFVLFWISRGKWSDAIIDSGREWIVPDALARGRLLYRDVVYWFGPFTPYFLAGAFRVFGSSFGTLVACGIATSTGVLGCLWLALRRVTGRLEAMLGTALAIPVLIFMPKSGGAILGMGMRMWHAAAFTLLAVWMVTGPARRPRRELLAGVLCALAGLCRAEWGIAALGGCGIAIACRDGLRATAWKRVFSMLGAFALVFGTGVGIFVLLAGPSAVISDGHVLLTGMPWETRRFLRTVSGMHDPLGGTIRLFVSFGFYLAAALLVSSIALWRSEPARRWTRLSAFAAVLLFIVHDRDYAGTIPMRFLSAFPMFGFLAVGFGLARRRSPAGSALAAFGALTVVLSFRRFFSVEDSPYVAPPMLFGIVAAVGILRIVVLTQRRRSPRGTLRRAFACSLAALILFGFLARSFQYAADRRVPLAEAAGWLSATPEMGARITRITELLRERKSPDRTLAVFPEGEVLNYTSGRDNPGRHMLYIPGYLESGNEPAILAELRRHPPDAIVIVRRRTSEYGHPFFGADYGASVAGWILRDYELAPLDERLTDPAGPAAPFRLFFRRPVPTASQRQ